MEHREIKLADCSGQHKDRGRKSEIRREKFSCGSGFQPRSCDFNEFSNFLILELTNRLVDELTP
jgi:hypothetical protein